MKSHKHVWNKTGNVRYVSPGEYEFKCDCGESKWIAESNGLPIGNIEEFLARHPEYTSKEIIKS